MELWNESLKTGIPAIDNQHKELIRKVYTLFHSTDTDRVSQTLEFFRKYVKKHFYDEQELQHKAQYPKADLHKKMRYDFMVAFREMKKEYDADRTQLPVLHKISRAIAGWLREHIIIHDKEFAMYYKSLGN